MNLSPQEIAAKLDEAQADIRLTANHRYQVRNGDKWGYVPGVTTVIDVYKDGLDGLMTWAGKCAIEMNDPTAWRKKRSDAAESGTDIHALIEQEIKRRLGQPTEALPATDEQLLIVQSWRDWADEHGFQPIACERRLISKSMGVCGTLDALAMIDNVLTIADWKSRDRKPEKPYRKEEVQSVTYRSILAEMLDVNVSEIAGRLVYFPRPSCPDASFDKPVDLPVTVDPIKTLDAFKGLLSVYRWQLAS